MNPGPAPRPPTERPRLNLAQSTTSIPTTSFDSMSLGPSSPAVSTPSVQFFSNNSSLSLVRSKTDGTASVIKEGHIRCKEDKFLAGWNQRYLILREFRLDFLKNENGKVMQSIQLNTVTGVSRSEDTRMAFEVTRIANPKDGANRQVMNRDLPTKTITCEVKNDDEIYDWIDKIYERCPGMGGVSNPTNFSHRIHVGFDPQTGGFVGLPQEWEKLLTASAITKEDYKKNPQAVIEVLEFYSEHNIRAQHPEMYSSTTPTPPAINQNKQLGFQAGNAVAPPRPAPPTNSQRYDSNQFLSKYQENTPPRSANGTPKPELQRAHTDKGGYDMEADARRIKELANQEQRRKMEEEAKRVREIQRQRERDKEREREREAEQNRMDQEAYNSSIPKTRTPLAKQELGGYGGGPEESANPASQRYNPSRAAPQAPGSQRQLQGAVKQPAVAAQRAAPTVSISNSRSPGRPSNEGAQNGQTSLRSPEAKYREPSPGAKYEGAADPRKEQSHTRQQPNGINGSAPASRLPAPVQQPKPLNLANKQQTSTPKAATDPRKEAEIALTTKKPVEDRAKEVRMSSMSESEVMAKLKQVVSKDNPLESYSKQKKIGQGASGSVYVARVKDGASSPIARELYRMHGPKGQVAIKQMDLRNQPRKELIVNEIIVMKDSKHPNIVNFLDSFLQEQNNELWVVMEFMEGGALTDVIDNNPVITEDQISTICFETCKGLAHLHSQDIIHRDIKSDNVLLDRIGNVKISKWSNPTGLTSC
jgi:hypothetical protein